MAGRVSDDLARLYRTIDNARNLRQQYALQNAERNLEYYRGNQWSLQQKMGSGLSPVTVNWVGTGIFRKFANLTFKIPEFSATPIYSAEAPVVGLLGELSTEVVPPDNVLRQVISNVVLELFKRSGSWDACKAALLDRFVYGFGVVYTGWDESFGPIGVRVSPYDFVWDIQRAWHDWYRGKYAARSFRMYLDEVKNNPAFSGTRDLKPAGADTWGWNPFPASRPRADDDEVTLVEAWFRDVQIGRSRRNARIIWAVSRPEKPLLVEDWPVHLRGRTEDDSFPFHVIMGHPIPELFAALSDIDIAKDVQDELNQLRTYSKARALLTLKLYCRKGVLDKDDAERLFSPVFAELVQGNADAAGDPIRFLPGPPYNMDLMQAGGDVMRDIAALQGVDESMRGIQAPKRQTATEAQLIASRSSALMAYEQVSFETLVSEVASALWQMVVQMQYTGLETRVGGEATVLGIEHLVPADVNVVVGSTRAEEKMMQLEALTQFATFLAQTGLLASPLNQAGIVDAGWLVKTMADKLDIRVPEEAFVGQQQTPAVGPEAIVQAAQQAQEPAGIEQLLGGEIPQGEEEE